MRVGVVLDRILAEIVAAKEDSAARDGALKRWRWQSSRKLLEPRSGASGLGVGLRIRADWVSSA